MKKYKLEISENQAIAINIALELFARVGMGQIKFVQECYYKKWNSFKTN
ncbi:MAG: hypothetical protein AABY32_00590 [Nanoarchaeota archaeon]|mgnify:CR=1 FL=1